MLSVQCTRPDVALYALPPSRSHSLGHGVTLLASAAEAYLDKIPRNSRHKASSYVDLGADRPLSYGGIGRPPDGQPCLAGWAPLIGGSPRKLDAGWSRSSAARSRLVETWLAVGWAASGVQEGTLWSNPVAWPRRSPARLRGEGDQTKSDLLTCPLNCRLYVMSYVDSRKDQTLLHRGIKAETSSQ